jgi:O-antigen ligase
LTEPDETGGNGATPTILLALLLAVPLLPNPGLFTNYDLPKWALLSLTVFVAGLVLLTRALSSREAAKVELPEQLSILSILIVAAFFLAKKAPDKKATILAVAHIGVLTTFALVAVRYVRNGDLAQRTLLFVAVAGAVGAMISITGHEAIGGPWGLAGTFGNPSFAAEFIAPALLLAAALFFLGRKVAAVALGLPMLVFMVLAKSRADWLGLGAGIVVLVVLEFRSRGRIKLPSRLAAILVIVVSIALPYLLSALPLPMLGRSDTVRVRELARASTLEMALDHPVTGVGLDGFAAAYPEYRSPEEFRLSLRRDVSFPHNLPLLVFAEAGIPGLLILLWFLYVTLMAGFKTLDAHPEDGIAFGALGAITAILVSAGFSGPLSHPPSALLFFLLTALLVGRRPRRYVADLKGRYRRAVPVVVLTVPALVAVWLTAPLLLADVHLKKARDLIAEQEGGLNEKVERLLEKSIARRPGVDAYRMLAFYRNGTGEPERALALTDELFRLDPKNQQGLMERGRALIALDRLDDALAVLEPLAKKRPGDPILFALRARPLLESLKTAPLEQVRSRAAELDRKAPELVLAMIRMAERIGKTDKDRALAILEECGGAEAIFYRVVVHAQHGEYNRAMELLRHAMNTGSAPPERLRNHPGLDPLRQRADFKRYIGDR